MISNRNEDHPEYLLGVQETSPLSISHEKFVSKIPSCAVAIRYSISSRAQVAKNKAQQGLKAEIRGLRIAP